MNYLLIGAIIIVILVIAYFVWPSESITVGGPVYGAINPQAPAYPRAPYVPKWARKLPTMSQV